MLDHIRYILSAARSEPMARPESSSGPDEASWAREAPVRPDGPSWDRVESPTLLKQWLDYYLSVGLGREAELIEQKIARQGRYSIYRL